MQTITYGDLAAFVKQCSLLMKENKDYLIALDASMGDGDLGLTMTAGFSAAEQFMEDNREADLGKVWMKLGMYKGKTYLSPSFCDGQIGRAVQQECRDRSRMPSSA